MEGRRAPRTRSRLANSPPRAKTPPGQASRKSPARKSPARKSPARRASPSSRKAAKIMSSKIAINISPKEKAAAEIKPKVEQRSSKLSGSPASTGKGLKVSPSTLSVSTSYSSSTTRTTKTSETVNIGSNSKQSVDGEDSEVSKITKIGSYLRRSLSKNLTPNFSSNQQTPTPTTEQSRQSRSASRSVYNYNEDEEEYSDHGTDNFESFRKAPSQQKSAVFARQLDAPKEFGGIYGAIIILLLIPSVTLYLLYSCTKNSCKFKSINFAGITPKTLDKFFNTEAAVVYFLFTTAVFLISAIPLGRVVSLNSDRGTVKYYFNSVAASVLTLAVLAGGEYLKYPVNDFIQRNYFKMCAISIFSSLFLSFFLYIRSKYVSQNQWNPYAKSGRFLQDFFIGREITPKWFNIVDIKLVQYRISLVTSLVLSVLFLYRNIVVPKLPQSNELTHLEKAAYFYHNTTFDSGALLASGFHLIYNLDAIFFEHHLSSSFELQHEGVGALLLLRYASTPFLLASVPKYLLDHKPIKIPTWAALIACVLFTFGVLLKRLSNKLKYEYRLNPSNPKFNFAETLHTFQGRRLLLSGLWGVVRQPNYSGDILALLSQLIPIAFKFSWPPVVSILLIVVFLVHRAIRVNARNSARYNSAWTRYCSRVQKILLPKVF